MSFRLALSVGAAFLLGSLVEAVFLLASDVGAVFALLVLYHRRSPKVHQILVTFCAETVFGKVGFPESMERLGPLLVHLS